MRQSYHPTVLQRQGTEHTRNLHELRLTQGLTYHVIIFAFVNPFSLEISASCLPLNLAYCAVK